jgi:protein-histidine pros-kinase
MDITDELATQLLNAAPDPTVIVDQQGTIVYANARVTEVLGYSHQELVGEMVEVLLPERVRGTTQCASDGRCFRLVCPA